MTILYGHSPTGELCSQHGGEPLRHGRPSFACPNNVDMRVPLQVVGSAVNK